MVQYPLSVFLLDKNISNISVHHTVPSVWMQPLNDSLDLEIEQKYWHLGLYNPIDT